MRSRNGGTRITTPAQTGKGVAPERLELRDAEAAVRAERGVPRDTDAVTEDRDQSLHRVAGHWGRPSMQRREVSTARTDTECTTAHTKGSDWIMIAREITLASRLHETTSWFPPWSAKAE
jgi:hypothetical protein